MLFECSNFNISFQIIPRYIESIENFEIGKIRKIREWLLEYFNSKLFRVI